MTAKMLGLEEGGLSVLTSVEEGNEALFIKMWKSLPSSTRN